MFTRFKYVMAAVLFIQMSSAQAADLKVEQILQAIETSGANWAPIENEFTRRTMEENGFLTGALPVHPDDIMPHQILRLPQVAALPDSFDWRSADGDWTTPVKDQAQCGSCWAFAALGQVEAWWKIQTGDSQTKIDLSEQFLLSCSDAGNCEQGGWAWKSLEFIQESGIALEADLPYSAKSDIPCSETKTGWEERSVSIPGWDFVTMDVADVDNIKNAVSRHPLSVNYEVFQDFYSYSRGVYEHVIGESTGWHAVVIVGWNDREQSWIVKNSWGSGWGDQGYFRIKWGDSSMGRYAPFIWDKLENSFLFPSVTKVDVRLTYGDAGRAEFVLGNYGDAPLQFYVNQLIGSHDEPDWLTIGNSAGQLNALEQDTVRLFINTRELVPGAYKRTLKIIANDIGSADVEVLVDLTVDAPERDVRLESFARPDKGFTLLFWSDIGCNIKNIGKQTMGEFDVVCRIFQNGDFIAADTNHVDELLAGNARLVELLPFKPMTTGELEFEVSIINAPDDYNDFNNVLNEKSLVSNLVEGFESPGNRWSLQGGWAFTDKLNGHDGGFSVHVYGGDFPYPAAMDAKMTYLSGFELQDVDTLFVAFWTRYVMADSNDVCFVEVSSDSLSWDMRDLFTGVQPAWTQRILNLTDLAQSGADKVWLRFCFRSDEDGGSVGALVDDLKVFTETIKVDGTENLETRVSNDVEMPTAFQLHQNYPNPFNPSTVLSYSVPVDAFATLSVYDLKGRLVAELVREQQQIGRHEVVWNAAAQSSGVYIYVLDVQSDSGEHFVAHKKMVVVK